MSYRQFLANGSRLLTIVALSICSDQSLQAQSQKSVQEQPHQPVLTRRLSHLSRSQHQIIQHNEAGGIRSLQTLFSAEATYQSTTGNGNYGTLEQLRKERLIDEVLAAGHRYGYLFRIRQEKRSSESQPSLEITAVPRTYGRTGLRSFYLDDTGVIRAINKKGAEASSADQLLVIDP